MQKNSEDSHIITAYRDHPQAKTTYAGFLVARDTQKHILLPHIQRYLSLDCLLPGITSRGTASGV